MPEWFQKRPDETDEEWWHRVNEIAVGHTTCECHPDGWHRRGGMT
jgi:hypothetical protein